MREKVRICLFLTKDLNEELKQIAYEQEISKNMLIQTVLKRYMLNKKDFK